MKAFVKFARTQFPTHDPYFRELPEGCCPGKFKGETEALIKGEKHSRKCFRPVVWNLSCCLLLTALTPVDAGKGCCPEVRSPGCSAVRRGCPHAASLQSLLVFKLLISPRPCPASHTCLYSGPSDLPSLLLDPFTRLIIKLT